MSLHPNFTPAILPWLRYCKVVKRTKSKIPLILALEGDSGRIVRLEIEIIPPEKEAEGVKEGSTFRLVERLVKGFLWSVGGWKLMVGGSSAVAQAIGNEFGPMGKRSLDAALLERIYQKDFQVVSMAIDQLPSSTDTSFCVGGHFHGYRIGFDIGASDIKVVALKEGKVLFGKEIPWDPKGETDSCYHYNKILAAIRLAESQLPRVDAIGGSMAGIMVNNQVRLASMFRRVSPLDFHTNVAKIFRRIARLWQIPFLVLNDGDVAAIAGANEMRCGSLLGIAMGSSQAAGFINEAGKINSWLNELSLVPVDVGKSQVRDHWTEDFGAGMNHFSQIAVNILGQNAGMEFAPDMGLPERLSQVQMEAQIGRERAVEIFKTIGIYLAFSLPFYRIFYPFKTLQLMGRVTSGAGGEIMVHHARRELERKFPQINECVTFHLPKEKNRRFGQAIAAAGLPSA